MSETATSNARTILYYTYVDGGNYKFPWGVLLDGELSNEDLNAIESKLCQDGSFIAHQVGLPSPQEFMSHNLGDGNHVFCSLDEDHDLFDISNGEGMTLHIGTDGCEIRVESDTPLMSCQELVERFEHIDKWDIEAEEHRLGITH